VIYTKDLILYTVRFRSCQLCFLSHTVYFLCSNWHLCNSVLYFFNDVCLPHLNKVYLFNTHCVGPGPSYAGDGRQAISHS